MRRAAGTTLAAETRPGYGLTRSEWKENGQLIRGYGYPFGVWGMVGLYQHKFGVMPCIATAKLQIIPQPPNTYPNVYRHSRAGMRAKRIQSAFESLTAISG